MNSPPKPRPLVKSTSLSNQISTAAAVVKAEQDARTMPPPPIPNPVNTLILEPEISGLARCLKGAVVKTGQVYNFYADTHRLGVQMHAPYPPRALTTSLGRETEKYDQLCDSIESQLLRSIAILERDYRREEQCIRSREALQMAIEKTAPSPPPNSTLTTETEATAIVDATQSVGATPRSSPSILLGRRPSAISISSLHRPTLPLKLDLSASSLRLTSEEASMFSSGLASPVTLAPKSARAVGPNEFPPELMAAFANTATDNQPIDIDLTIPEMSQGNDEHSKLSINAAAGSSSDKPIELDLDSMDIDMASMTDLFGDPTDNGSSADVNAGLFSPIDEDPNIQKLEDSVIQKPLKEEESGNFLGTLHSGDNGADLFSSFGSNSQPDMPMDMKIKQGAAEESISSSITGIPSFPISAQQTTSTDDTMATDTPFDINALDLSSLDPGFFSETVHDGMNFGNVDMHEFLGLSNTNEGDVEGRSI
ncbi:hypothetical protein BDQ12DRAFT_720652 [Crucibulum laeve]|uniref:Uncharacterized protein n=1 Tax=Crucibulum laeve TaxID=68775 RepID=A0A5C3M908_9AGAR|nr:hypothetical protein BDQ12DRAFT_720652 [Crucibulum laeve]